MNGNSIVELKAYGKINFHIGEIMDKRGITRGALSKLINVHYEVATRWYEGNMERIDADILARICFVLDCNVSDLISYSK